MVKSRPSDALSKKHSAIKTDHFFAALLELDVKTSTTCPSTPVTNLPMVDRKSSSPRRNVQKQPIDDQGLLAQAAKKLIA